MDTGKKIKLIRTFRGLTQKELGEACGIHEVAIRKYELGKNLPKPEQLRKIAEALNALYNKEVVEMPEVIYKVDLPAFTGRNVPINLKDWQAMKELLASGNQTNDNYEIWKTIRPSVTKVNHEK